jgi:hyaluronan synthase
VSGVRAPLAAHLSRRSTTVLGPMVLAGLILWGIHHVVSLSDVLHGRSDRELAVVYAAMYIPLCWSLGAGYFDRPYRVTARKQRRVDTLVVAALVPVYNEDAEFLRECLASIFRQSRRVDIVSVVDDGSNCVEYDELEDWFLAEAERVGVRAHWTRQANAGKRHAQVAAAAHAPDADIYLTVDSDSMLDVDATLEGLKPFADPRVNSVASLLLAANHRHNLLTRLADLWYVTSQLTDRSAMSGLGSVLVNAGSLAYYRAHVIRDNVDAYLNETFFGRRVGFSDDSLLTLYAVADGRAVQQPSSFVFSHLPTNFGHYRRQQLRWFRGSFIRSWWRMRYLPVGRFAYWLHMSRWLVYGSAAATMVATVNYVQFTPAVIMWTVLVQGGLCYGLMLRYFAVRRNDERLRYRLATYLLGPIACLWAYSVLRVLRWWGMATCLDMGWATRKTVEVIADRRDPHLVSR